jgi:hypothetical protein
VFTYTSISIVSADEPQLSAVTPTHVPVGTEHAYTVEKPKLSQEEQVQVDESADLSDLMNQLKNLSGK